MNAKPKSPGMILIVDDDPELRRTLLFILRRRFEATEAASGREAIEAVTRSCPDLLLLDLSMPDLSGIEVLEVVRRIRPSLPVIMLTAHREIEDAARALDLGAKTYITKPFEADVLVENVTSVLETSRGVRVPDDKPWRIAD